jgi:MOSC domain-containing protein YiiM
MEAAAKVEAVCLSVSHARVAKAPQDEAYLGPYGFAGDRHEAEFRRSKDGEMRANHRQWSAVSSEEVTQICESMDVPAFAPGEMGENLRLAGLRLADVPAGTVLEAPSGARLLVSGRNDPCVNAARELSQKYGPVVGREFVKQSYGLRGIVGTVLETGVVRAGDELRVVSTEPAVP